jgi:hypothetical protein
MTLVGHRHRRIGRLALALVLAACLLAVPGSARAAASGADTPGPRAVIAFVPGATLDDFARLPGASVGMLGASQGQYQQVQALLDLSQGVRTSQAAYDPTDPPALGVRADGTVSGWAAAVRRADAAPAQIVPGLLAGTIPGGAAYVGQPSAPRDAAIVAADRAGHIARMELVDAGAPAAALRLLRDHRLVVARLPDDAALRALVRQRPPHTLVIAIADPPATNATRLLPVAVLGFGGGRTLTSSTTRTDGLVAGIDVAPTVLDWLRLTVPPTMTGQPIELDGPLDVAALRSTQARLLVVTTRRYPTLASLSAAWALLTLVAFAVRRRAGARWGVRVGALAVLWLLPVLLAFAVFSPGRLVEEIGVGVLSLALGALSDRLVRWPLAPVVPGLIGPAAYVIDLAFGSPLIARSLLGPNPLYGSRFYGVGNELESTLPVLLLVGIAAGAVALGRGRRSGALAGAFAVGGLVLGAALGSGRLGADVGGVITVGAGFAVAVLLSLPGAITKRRVALAVLVPVAAVGALALLDLATGGNSHFTRSVLRANGDQALGDVVRRRLTLAFHNFGRGLMPWLTAIGLGAIAWAIWQRRRLFEDLPGGDAWAAALAGAAAAGVVGALANDSGPLLFVFSMFGAVWALAYLRSGPDRRVL